MKQTNTLKLLQSWIEKDDSPLSGMLVVFNRDNSYRADETNKWLTKHATPYDSKCKFNEIAKTLFDSIQIILSGIGGDISTEKTTHEKRGDEEERGESKAKSKSGAAKKMSATAADFQHVDEDVDLISDLLSHKPLSDADQKEVESLQKRHHEILALSNSKELKPIDLWKQSRALLIEIPNERLSGETMEDKAENLRGFLREKADEVQKQISYIKQAPELPAKKKNLLRELFLVAHDSKRATDVAMFIKPKLLESLIDDFENTSKKDPVDLRGVLERYKTDYKLLEQTLAIRNTKLDKLLKQEPEAEVSEGDRRLNAFKKYIAHIFPLSPKEVYEQINEMVDQFGVERIRSNETPRKFGELANEVYQKFLSDGTRTKASFYDELGADERTRLTLAIGRACHYALHHNDPDYELTRSKDINRLKLPAGMSLQRVMVRVAGMNIQGDGFESRLKGFEPEDADEDKLKDAINSVIERCKSQRKSKGGPPDGSVPDR